jgi:uncharacterized protein involved in response to NO
MNHVSVGPSGTAKNSVLNFIKLDFLASLEPYRVLFPVGWFFALFGAAVWLPTLYSASPGYPLPLHSNLMIGGFLLSFAQGFLMTALPRMSGTSQASTMELSAASLLTVLEGLFVVVEGDGVGTRLAAIGILVALVIFGRRRLKTARRRPPGPFVLVAFGLGAGLVGNVMLLLSTLFDLAPLGQLGHALYFQAMILFFVFGVGSRLIPFLLQIDQRPDDPNVYTDAQLIPLLSAIGGIFMITYVIDVFVSLPVGAFMRAALASWIALKVWRLHAKAQYPGALKWGLKTAAWFVPTGLWMAAFIPQAQTHWLHLTFISGFGLMAMMIATRVSLAHGAHGLELERTSKALFVVTGLTVLAAITRVTAPLIPSIYLKHLGYAALTWIAALLVWGWYFLRKTLRRGAG